MRLVGHRGASALFPENTLASFRASLGLCGAFEMDIQRLRTGELLILHDSTLRRTGREIGARARGEMEERWRGDGGKKGESSLLDAPVRELSMAEVLRFEVGSWMSEKWALEYAPPFRSALSLLHESACEKAHTFAELKADRSELGAGYDAGLPAAAEAEVRAEAVLPHQARYLLTCRLNVRDPSITCYLRHPSRRVLFFSRLAMLCCLAPKACLTWISFSLSLVIEMKRRMPDYRALLLGHASSAEQAWAYAKLCEQHDLDGIDLNVSEFVTKELVDWHHERNKVVAVWVDRAPALNDTKVGLCSD
ncbi:MAG: hypothetical protein SGPRY_011944 [Prymnesium sp.]